MNVRIENYVRGGEKRDLNFFRKELEDVCFFFEKKSSESCEDFLLRKKYVPYI